MSTKKETTEQPTATELQRRMSIITAKIGAIQKKKEQGGPAYAYRSIDDVMNKLNPLLAEEQVTISSRVISHSLNGREYEKAGYGGAAPQKKFAFYATVVLAVSFHHGAETETWEEVAMSEDNSDKALTQAMSMAYKYAILRKFCVLTEDLAGTDGDKKPSQDAPAPRPVATKITLEKGSEAWTKVVNALTQKTGTMEQAKGKYEISAALETELNELVAKADAARLGGAK